MPQGTSSTPDLMGIVSRQITPDVIRSVASQLSEDAARPRRRCQPPFRRR